MSCSSTFFVSLTVSSICLVLLPEVVLWKVAGAAMAISGLVVYRSGLVYYHCHKDKEVGYALYSLKNSVHSPVWTLLTHAWVNVLQALVSLSSVM